MLAQGLPAINHEWTMVAVHEIEVINDFLLKAFTGHK